MGKSKGIFMKSDKSQEILMKSDKSQGILMKSDKSQAISMKRRVVTALPKNDALNPPPKRFTWRKNGQGKLKNLNIQVLLLVGSPPPYKEYNLCFLRVHGQTFEFTEGVYFPKSSAALFRCLPTTTFARLC